MITPASVHDWAMLVGMLAMLGSFAVLIHRSIAREAEAERARAVPPELAFHLRGESVDAELTSVGAR